MESVQVKWRIQEKTKDTQLFRSQVPSFFWGKKQKRKVRTTLRAFLEISHLCCGTTAFSACTAADFSNCFYFF